MKTTLKTLTALGLICSALNIVQAEDAVKKPDCGNVAQDTFGKCAQQSGENEKKAGISQRAFQTGLENLKGLPEDMHSDVKSKVDIPLTKAERERRDVMLGHLVSTAQKYLTDAENEQMRQLIGKGWSRKSLKDQKARKS
ncbi:hypothetical protein Cva_01669 [Caedimonas varicaedens]|uniref:LTXXQ motif protein n=1 Tax=Caedimonas varicaedens TaxID=1629334 RepID=A0A0K8MGK7_9PROT|nr:hypothetical protein Cva_01669 [Caedimonas varicaedens]